MPTTIESLKELWYYRELFFFMVWRDIKIRYKQSILGVLWAIIQPFLTMLIFTLVFHRVAKFEPSLGLPYEIFSYCGLLAWTYFSGAISQAGLSLVANRDLITKVYFPRIIIPAATAIRGLLDFGIATVFFLILMLYHDVPITWGLLFWPVLMLLLLVLALGLGMIFAATNVRYRDVQYALPFFVQLGLFVSPVIYSLDALPEKWQLILALNPISGIIETLRVCLVPSAQIDWQLLGISLTTTLFIFAFGTFYFRKTARDFADVI
jgi:lipopolysaccharide transport system permease protein